MIKHHPLDRRERLKLRVKKEQPKPIKDLAGHVRKRVAVEQLKAQEAEHEIREEVWGIN